MAAGHVRWADRWVRKVMGGGGRGKRADGERVGWREGRAEREGWRERDRQLSSPSWPPRPVVAPFLAASSRCGQQASVREDVQTGGHACPHVIPHAHSHGRGRGRGGWWGDRRSGARHAAILLQLACESLKSHVTVVRGRFVRVSASVGGTMGGNGRAIVATWLGLAAWRAAWEWRTIVLGLSALRGNADK